MKAAIVTLIAVAFCGCAATRNRPVESATNPKPVGADVELAHRFLDALLRPTSTNFQIIADANSEESMNHVPLAARNKDLSSRLAVLRLAPSPTIRVNLRSADVPEPWGSGNHIYIYDTVNGRLKEVGRHQPGEDSADMWIRIDHWPDGTRLVSLSFTWIEDLKTNIFHLRPGERTFRFAIASRPVT